MAEKERRPPVSDEATPPKKGQPSPHRRSPAGPPRPVPGGPLPTPAEKLARRAHRRRSKAPSVQELIQRAAQLKIPGLIIYPETVEKGKSSTQGRYLVATKCQHCGHEMPQVLHALEDGKRKKCRCQGGVRNHPNPIRYSLSFRYRAMIQRCEKTTHVSDHNYRGRGIQVHFESTKEFVEWALREFPEQAINGFSEWDFDRIDNDGHYAKDNLRLVRRGVNHLNRRDSVNSIRTRGDALLKKHPHITYSPKTVRNLIQQGYTEQEILERHTRNIKAPRRPRSKNPVNRNTEEILAGVSIIYPISHPKHGTNAL